VLAQVSRRKIRLPESGIEIALLDWGGDGPIALLHHANGYCAAIWAPVAERVRTPTLIQWAKRGDFDRQDFDKLAQRLIDARVIEVDSGHLVPMERPDCVAEAVIDFATQER